MNLKILSFFIFTLASNCLTAEETPVEKTVRALLTEFFEESDAIEMPEEQFEDALDRAIERFAEKAPEWTKEDANKLKAGKPLVDDYALTLKKWKEHEEDKHSKWFVEKANEKKLSELEKRALTDILLLVDPPRRNAKMPAAVNNAKDIYVGIRDYAIKESKALGDLGDEKTANQLLRELFEKGYFQDETPFFVKGFKGFTEGDGNIIGDEALKAGENVWAINAGVNIITAHPNTPLLLYPIKLEKGKIIADAKPIDGQVIVLYSDGSAVLHKIGPKGEIMTDKGPLYSVKHPIWRDKKGRFTPPDFRLPELPKK